MRLLPVIALGLSVAAVECAAQPWNIPNGPKFEGIEHGSFTSRVLGVEVGFNVWLPPGYATGHERYPVLYFLPGNGGDEYSCVSPVGRRLRDAVAAGTLPPVICVFCNPGNGTFRDNRTPGVLGETMFVRDFVPMIDTRYRTVAAQQGRAVLGFSMGGGGAMRFVLGHPELFCAGVGWGNPGLRAEEPAMQKLDAVKQSGAGIMLVVGKEDAPQGQKRAPIFVKALADKGIPAILKTPEGVRHSVEQYFEATWPDAMKFLSERLRPQGE